jgi:hypothetical protein
MTMLLGRHMGIDGRNSQYEFFLQLREVSGSAPRLGTIGTSQV